MIAPERSVPPQTLAFSITATGTSPEALASVSSSSASSCSSRFAQARPAVPPPDDRDADLDPLVLAVELALDEFLLRVDRAAGSRRASTSVAGHRR